MSSGKVHDKGCVLFGLAAIVPAIAILGVETLPLAIGYATGSIWLSPDIDLAHSRPSRRLGPLSGLWWFYREASGHRGFSHAPIFGTISRMIYAWALLMIPVVVTKLFWGTVFFSDIVPDTRTLILTGIGLELSTLVHLFLDYVWVRQ